MRVEQVDFIAIPTRDLERAIAWYRDVLGLPVSEVTEGELETANVTLSFWEPERENLPDVCRVCDQLEHDKTVPIVNSPTYAWRHLGLVETDGTPTRRGMIFSFFHGGEGLAVAAALEDETYPVDELVFDLANIRAGPRFADEDAPMGGGQLFRADALLRVPAELSIDELRAELEGLADDLMVELSLDAVDERSR